MFLKNSISQFFYGQMFKKIATFLAMEAEKRDPENEVGLQRKASATRCNIRDVDGNRK